MLELDIEDARDLIREKIDEIVDRYDEYSDEVIRQMDKIYDLCNNATEDNWHDIIADIQNLTKPYI